MFLFPGGPQDLGGQGKVEHCLPQIPCTLSTRRPGGQDVYPQGHDLCLHCPLLPVPRGLEEPDLEKREERGYC